MAKKKSSRQKNKFKVIPKVYEFKVTLQGTEPLVWRKFLAHEFIELSELHMLIQMTMGWEASHLYEFKINDKSYSESDGLDELDMEEAEGVMLCEVLGSVKKFKYIYDFGDNWSHEIEIMRTLETDPRMYYPVCVGGENACPPEDCGGIYGFDQLKKTISGEESREKDELLSWIGGYYNPSTFDPNFVNKHLLWVPADLID
jgi:hypothetical protein